ncbi:MAG: DUF6464 family protein [Microcoleus sp.]
MAGYIGNFECFYNALSTDLRCTVNPRGPCEGCEDFVANPDLPEQYVDLLRQRQRRK